MTDEQLNRIYCAEKGTLGLRAVAAAAFEEGVIKAYRDLQPKIDAARAEALEDVCKFIEGEYPLTRKPLQAAIRALKSASGGEDQLAGEERKGEEWTGHCGYTFGGGIWKENRRRTPGTRADRIASWPDDEKGTDWSNPADRRQPAEQEIIRGGVDFIMGPGSDEGTRMGRHPDSPYPQAGAPSETPRTTPGCVYCFWPKEPCIHLSNVDCSYLEKLLDELRAALAARDDAIRLRDLAVRELDESEKARDALRKFALAAMSASPETDALFARHVAEATARIAGKPK